MDYRFEPLAAEHFAAACHTVVEATHWLNAKGVRQWDEPIPETTYRERHHAGQNHGLFVDDKLAVVMTLKPEPPSYWTPVRTLDPTALWLSTLAVASSFRGQGLGTVALEHAERYLAERGVPLLYLDCVDREGVLPRFYRAAGYTMLERREWPDWTMCLFEKRLAAAPG